MRSSTSIYIAASFIFAAINYKLVWNYDDRDRRLSKDARSLYGSAPPLRDSPATKRKVLVSADDDLNRHDDGSAVMLDFLDDDRSEHDELTENHASGFGNLPIRGYSHHTDIQHEFELSRDIGELLYGDDNYNADDDDEDLLTFFLRKRENGYKSMAAGSQNSLQDEDVSSGAKEEQKNADDDRAQDDQVQEDDQTTSRNDTIDEDIKDSIWSHRPKQNRTGIPWRGWPDVAKGSDANWWRQSQQCCEVDHICHKRKTNEWFYYQPKLSEQPLFQPSFQLRCEPLRYDRGLIANEQINITVDASFKVDDITYIDDYTFQFPTSSKKQGGSCKVSSVPIHMTLQSMFNYMIGEFYSRTLLPLHRLMTSTTPQPGDHESLRPWQQNIQFYVHLSHGDQALYDGHKLLLSGMLSRNDSAEVKAAVDLFTPHSLDENADDDDCDCYNKMVFCGYAIYEDSLEKESLSDDHSQVKDEPKDLTPDADVRYTLWSSSNTADDLDSRGYCGKGEISMDLYSCDEWADLRYFLASNFINHYPSLKKDVIRFRRDILLKLQFIDNKYNGDTTEWKFVGLTQRSYRRSWINLPDIADECNAIHNKDSSKKVACIEVNVEKTASPYDQLVLHQSVDALVGVHGAQLTQAVLLPPHSHVLELLPWVTDYIRGKWVQTRHTPTPLGIIFHNTDLYHLGFSLDRDSVPLCEDEVGSEEEKECFISKNNRMKFIWENRDFNVKSDTVIQFIEHSILSHNYDCSNITGTLDAKFVQYNVWCQADDASDDKKSPLDPTLKLRHFYDSMPDSFRAKTKKKKTMNV